MPEADIDADLQPNSHNRGLKPTYGLHVINGAVLIHHPEVD